MRETWRSGSAGFLVCALLALGLYLWMYLGAPGVAAETDVAHMAHMSGETEAEARSWLIEHMRWGGSRRRSPSSH